MNSETKYIGEKILTNKTPDFILEWQPEMSDQKQKSCVWPTQSALYN